MQKYPEVRTLFSSLSFKIFWEKIHPISYQKHFVSRMINLTKYYDVKIKLTKITQNSYQFKVTSMMIFNPSTIYNNFNYALFKI